MTLIEYAAITAGTDKLAKSDTMSVLLGLNGEVGSILSALKKHRRDTTPSSQFVLTAEEELGDCLWYLCALCRRQNIDFEGIFKSDAPQGVAIATELSAYPIAYSATEEPIELDEALADLCLAAAQTLTTFKERRKVTNIDSVARSYLRVVQAGGFNFDRIARQNVGKATSRFEGTWLESLETFDNSVPVDEQLPRKFRFEIHAKSASLSYISYFGVKIGDPLRDNHSQDDGYRFHDVFHFANAAILGWSPVLRSLLKLKRKSIPQIDETEDSGRAIVIEEGLTAWLFSKASHYNFFDGVETLPFDLLSTAREFVSGYEVERCPAWLWQKSILRGYSAFREILEHGEGAILGDFARREIWFEKL